MILLDRYLNVLERGKLTQQQFILLYILFRRDVGSLKKYKNLFPTDDGTLIGKFAFDDLVQRKFIINIAPEGQKVRIIDLHVTNEFLKYFIDEVSAIDELWENYPAYGRTSTGDRMILKAGDQHKLGKIYWIHIGQSVDEHIEVIKDLKWGVQNNYVKMGITKFIEGKAWKDIRKERGNREAFDPNSKDDALTSPVGNML